MIYTVPVRVLDIKQEKAYLIKALNCYFVGVFITKHGVLSVQHPASRKTISTGDVQSIAEIHEFPK
jgi:hypothetical protein